MTESMRPGPPFWQAGLLALLIASLVLATTFGPAGIGAGEVWTIVLSHLGLPASAGTEPLRSAIVWDLRLPRLVAAAAVGAGLALCGAVLQTLTRNPLADPFLLGLSSGASLGAIAFMVAGLGLLLPVGAFLGAGGAMILTLTLAHMLGGAAPSRIILLGVAVSALASALGSLLVFWTATGDSYREILAWLMGSLSGSGWREAGLATLAIAVIGLPVLLAARALDAFAFGETSAAALGIDVARTRWLLLGGTALLTGILVSFAGTIGFVGLVVPHIARLMVGARHRLMLPATALLGAILMVWADTAARSFFAPRELPVGILTAILGTPAFILVLMRNRRLT